MNYSKLLSVAIMSALAAGNSVADPARKKPLEELVITGIAALNCRCHRFLVPLR
ncbi:hypothetical protein [Oceanicoccus sp. KOV_DT_Chl]|uniref:hypothetical protein n=1 Tax=Oceanicoccus sp. KOV_DT_Chl TaxID=1904639 RepID=UPI00135992A1|nr:hypothetical protein [Oceanicoccus sp. KOV_DT_Chl]